MKLMDNVKSVEYLRENADEIVRSLGDQGEPLIVTRDGEAGVVVQDIAEYEKMQDAFALLRILALGRRQIEEEMARPSSEVFADIRERLRSDP